MTVIFETEGESPLHCENNCLPAEVAAWNVGEYMAGRPIVKRLLAANVLSREQRKELRSTRNLLYPINKIERGIHGRTDYVVRVTLGKPESADE